MPGTRYMNLRTRNLVEIFNEGRGTLTIATVTDDGYGRRRRVRATSFHDDYLARNGQPHTSGYVPVDTLPGSNPRSMKTEMTRMEMLESLDGMTTAELARLIAEREAIVAELKPVIDQGRKIIKARRPAATTESYGDITIALTGSGEEFDATTALKNLTVEEIKEISVLKPDPKRAREYFKDKPDRLALCMKPRSLSLTIRETTDEDRLRDIAARALVVQKAAEATESAESILPVGSDEQFELDEPPF